MKNFSVITVITIALLSNAIVACAEENNKFSIASTLPALHSLVLNMVENTKDVNTDLLLGGNISPHDYQLKPSDMKKISKADVIIGISPDMETFIKNPYKNKSKQQNWVFLEDVLELKELRNSGKWDNKDLHHEHKASDEHHHHHNHSNRLDYHVWLSPKLMIITLGTIKDTLIKNNPQNELMYKTNYEKTLSWLKDLDLKTQKAFENKKIKFLVFHDAFQYFENDYGLSAAGSVTGTFNTTSAKRYRELLNKADADKISCIVYENNSDIADKIAKQLNIKSISIDLLGSQITKDKNFFFNYINNIKDNFLKCLISN